MKEFKLGAHATAKTVVNDGNTAKAMGSGKLAVFATPAMIALMEEAATSCAAQFLDEGSETVGTMISDVYKRQGLSRPDQGAFDPRKPCDRIRKINRTVQTMQRPLRAASFSVL